FGFPVWASTFAPPIRTFVDENREALKEKRIAAFACQSGSGAEKAFAKLLKLIGKDSFTATAVFIDPKEKHSIGTDAAIKEFCKSLG
ncbi:MAG: flavodoxin, partial [Lachnospiraceae bacterium]|nr:flavodoxin [Lachnospiraceae bacterium]